MNTNDILSELYSIVGRVNEIIGMIEDHGLEEQENVPCMSVANVPCMSVSDGDFVIKNLERNPGLFRIAKLEGDTLTVFCQEENLLALREFLECPENTVEGRTFRDDAWFGGFPPRLAIGGEFAFDFETLIPMPNSKNIAINYTNVGDTHGFFKRID